MQGINSAAIAIGGVHERELIATQDIRAGGDFSPTQNFSRCNCYKLVTVLQHDEAHQAPMLSFKRCPLSH